MTDFDIASVVLSAVLGLDAFVAFRCGLTILGLTIAFRNAMPLSIEQRIRDQAVRIRDLNERRSIGRQ